MSNQPPANYGASLPRFQTGELIADRFEVVGFIARGGMGEVYEVKDHFLRGMSVALKIIRPEIASDAVNTRRFEQEVILARRVSHPNLCPIYDIFRSEEPAPGFLFLTMKFIHGETLDARMKRSGKIPMEDGLEICRQLLSGVSALHDAGIIHRDLKPNNIMLEQTDGRLNVSIMDFGLARQHQAEATVGQTFSIAGTIGYMAPELLRGEPPTKASDLFALGIVLHEVLTGTRPEANRRDSSLSATPGLRAAGAPLYVTQAIEGFLSYDPDKRSRSFERVRSEVSGAGSGPISRRSATDPSRLRWSMGALAVAAILMATAMWLTPARTPTVLHSQQITFSAESKDKPLVSDGSRLYFQSHGGPVEMALSGGMIAPLKFSESGLKILSISADGSKALALKSVPEPGAYDQGTLWVASPLGGTARRAGPQHAEDARWSPDGSSILFSDKGAIYSAKEDGSDRRKIWQTDGAIDSLGFSPDGRELTFAAITKQNSRLWRVGVDGSGAHLLLPDWPAPSDQWLGQWTPGGKHFVFLSDREGRGNVYEMVQPRWFEFWKRPIAALITGNQIDIRALAPGPDGESLFVVGEADQGAMQVFDPASGKYVPFLNGLPALSFVISPDRQWMAYSEFPSGNLWKSRLDGAEPMQLTTSPAYMMQWSRSGKSLAYSDGQKIYIIPADGGAPQRLMGGSELEGFPSWTPDDKSVAFSYYNPENPHNEGIHVVDVASGKISIMPDTQGSTLPSWSPDGKYLVAMTQQPSRMMLYSVETMAWTELKQFDTPWGFWIWSGDSKSIYMRVVEGAVGIYRLSVPSGKWERVSGLDGVNLRGDFDYSLPSLSADGRPVLMSHVGVAQIYSLRWR